MSTPFRLLLPRQIYTEMVSQAQAELPNECCGMLAGKIEQAPEGPVARVMRRFPLINEAASPKEFLSYPFDAVKACRSEGIEFLAIYHSHPSSRPVPSAIDLARNYYSDLLCLIISLETDEPEMRGWWLKGDGYSEGEVQILLPEGKPMDITSEFIAATINACEANKRLADRAVEQLPDDKLHVALDANTNSIAVIMKHVAGNLQSRWTDFLTTDGEKPTRNRDGEFIDSFTSRAALLEFWENGWARLLETLRSLKADDLAKTVLIRGEPHTVPLAIQRSLGHSCYHIGQIVQLARVLADENWKTLTIPRGQSNQFNQANWGQKGRSHS